MFDDGTESSDFFVLEETKVKWRILYSIYGSEEDDAECVILKDTVGQARVFIR